VIPSAGVWEDSWGTITGKGEEGIEGFLRVAIISLEIIGDSESWKLDCIKYMCLRRCSVHFSSDLLDVVVHPLVGSAI